MPTQNTDQPKSASQIVAEARQIIPELTVAQAKEELDQGQFGLVLDVYEDDVKGKREVSAPFLSIISFRELNLSNSRRCLACVLSCMGD